jgi:hypothetical protein
MKASRLSPERKCNHAHVVEKKLMLGGGILSAAIQIHLTHASLCS